jgi:MtN3 and saliva related transmembrane protein
MPGIAFLSEELKGFVSILSLMEVIGFIAGALATSSTIPQLVRIFKLKSAYEISTAFTILLLCGLSLWLVYGIYLELTPVIIWNAIGTGCVATLIFAKLKYNREN